MSKMITAEFDNSIVQFNTDGYINATAVAKKYGKDLSNWMRSPDTIEYIEALNSNSVNITPLELVITKQGRYGGTWLHPKLAVLFARWIDVKFAIWCDEQIEHIIHGRPEEIDWRRERHTSALAYKTQNDVLKMIRQAQGKTTEGYHYANEARLVNTCVTGSPDNINRDKAPMEILDLLSKVSMKNTVLIGMGLTYDQRKPLLIEYAEQLKSNIKVKVLK